MGGVGRAAERSSAGTRIHAGGLGLPTNERAIVSYLTNSYGGVGKKTAESLVEAFGANIFDVFETEPGRVAEIVPRRASQVLAEWRADFARRSGEPVDQEGAEPEPERGSAQGLETESVPDSSSPDSSSSSSFDSSSSSSFDSSSSSSFDSSVSVPRSGGAGRRTRPGPRRPPSSGSDE